MHRLGLLQLSWHTVNRGLIPIIDVRRPVKDGRTGKRRYEGLYDEQGRPVCVGGQPMAYLGTDPNGAHHFRCPPGGCALRDKINWSRYCDSEHSEKPEGKLLRIMGVVPRFRELWKELYKWRTTIERLFSSAKRSRLMNQHRHLDMERINLHERMSVLTGALTALTHLQADDWRHMRHMRIRLAGRDRKTADPGTAG